MTSFSMLLRHAPLVFAFASAPFTANAQESRATPSIGKATSTVYRHVMPDGRIVYSDKILKSGKVKETIVIDPPIEGNAWATGSNKRPDIPPQVKNTPVNQVTSIANPDRRRTTSDIEADIVKAEMLLEDAKKEKEAGVEPLPGERTGTVSGNSRLNEAYWERQQALTEQVEKAQTMLENVRSERSALQAVR